MTFEPDDRTEELVPLHRSDFEKKSSTAQMPSKSSGQARLVVEFFFDFEPKFLAQYGCKDGVEYVRRVAEQLRSNSITLDNVEALVRSHGDLDWRIDAAK